METRRKSLHCVFGSGSPVLLLAVGGDWFRPRVLCLALRVRLVCGRVCLSQLPPFCFYRAEAVTVNLVFNDVSCLEIQLLRFLRKSFTTADCVAG